MKSGFGRRPWSIRLPNEPEWEKAARGGLEIPDSPVIAAAPFGRRDARLCVSDKCMKKNENPEREYPWGDEPDPNRANYADSQVGATSAVGCFPGGVSPYGVIDMSGNVWEWTMCTKKEYPYIPGDGREIVNSEEPRVVRGGAFYLNQGGVRSASRGDRYPDVRRRGIGFRVVASPFPL